MKMNYNEYIKGIHRIGTATMMGTQVMTFVPAIFIWFVFDCFPGWAIAGVMGAMVPMFFTMFFKKKKD